MPPLLSESARRARWRAIRPFLTGSVLDLGCGFTDFPDLLTPEQTYTGADAWPEALAWSAERYPAHNFVACDLNTEALALPEASFDTVVMIAVLEHLHRPLNALTQARRMLKPAAHFILTTPSHLGDLAHKIGGRIGLFYTEEQVQHVQIFSRRMLVCLAEEADLRIEHFGYFAYGMNQLLVCSKKD